jgi:predicted small lipoprotein YifL
MLRHRRFRARLALAALLALGVAGCGIKGPLVHAKPEAAKPADDAKRDSRPPAPRL